MYEKSFRILEDKLIKEDAKDLVHDVAYDMEDMIKKKEEAVHVRITRLIQKLINL